MAESFSDAFYTDFRLEVIVSRDEGKVALILAGLAADGSPLPAKIVQAQSPSGTKVVNWTAERFGKAPTVPSPASRDPNDVLMNSQVGYPVSMTDPGAGRHYWRLSGTYFYQLLLPLDPTRGLPGVSMPPDIDGRTPATNAIPGSVFSQNLIDPAGKK
jgi:hypothetical protein